MSDQQVNVKISADASGMKGGSDEAVSALNALNERIQSLGEGFKYVAEAFALKEVIQQIGEFEKQFAELSEQIQRTTQITGLSTKEVQQFNFAVMMTGGNIETATVTLERFEKNLADAASGSGRAADLLKTLGINVNDANGKMRPMHDILGDLAEKFKDSEDGATKTAYAIELMGRGGAQLIPVLDKGREGLAELNDELKKSGSELTPEQTKKFGELNESIKLLNASWQGFKLAIADTFEPAAEKVVSWLTKIANLATSIAQANKTNDYTTALPAFATPEQIKDYLNQQKNKGQNSTSVAKDNSIKKSLPRLPKTSSPSGGASDNEYDDEEEEQKKLALLKIDNDKLVAQQQIQIEQQKNKEMLDLNQITNAEYLQRKLVLQEQLDDIDLKAAEKKQAVLANDVVAQQKAANEILVIKQKQAQQEEAINHEIVMERMKDFQQLGQSIKTSFEDSFASFLDGTKSAKNAFRDFVQSVRTDMARMVAKNVSNSIFGALQSGLGSAFGGARAGGGEVSSDKGYVVGENGPEYFVPNGSGTILNADQMSSMGGGATIHMNINTPNAQSFRQNTGQMMADMQSALRRSRRNA